MPISDGSRLSTRQRLKLAAFSLLLFLVPSTSLTCCYAPPPPPTQTPTLPTFTSPLSPIPTPTPTPTPEARRLLRERLLAEGRFPGEIVRELKS